MEPVMFVPSDNKKMHKIYKNPPAGLPANWTLTACGYILHNKPLTEEQLGLPTYKKYKPCQHCFG